MKKHIDAKSFNEEVVTGIMRIVALCTTELMKEVDGDKRTTANAYNGGRKEIAKDVLTIIKNINLEAK